MPRLRARRMEICVKAAATFVARGYDSTSMNDIAAALGITKAGLYHYISSKESLLFEILSLGLDAIDEDVVEPTRPIADPRARLADILLRHALLATCHRGVVTLLLDQMHGLSRADQRVVTARLRRYVHYVREAVEQLQAAGRLRALDPTVVAFTALGVVQWLPKWFRHDGGLTSEAVAGEVVDIVMHAIEPGREAPPLAAGAADRSGGGRAPLVPTRRGRGRPRRDAYSFASRNPDRVKFCTTAARAFVERGYDATSVHEIATALGVTKAGLYHHVSSKDDLFMEILTLGMDWLEEDVVRPATALSDPRERLTEVLTRHARLTSLNEPWITVLLDDPASISHAGRHAIDRRRKHYVDFVRATMMALRDRGQLRSLHPTVAAFTALAMVLWIPRWLRPKGRVSPEEVARQVAEMALAGLLAHPR